MRGETQKLGGWFNGPLNAKNVQATDSDIALAFQHKQEKSDTQQILEAIAALAAGLTARDRQLSAISEQAKDNFEAHKGAMLEIATGVNLLNQAAASRLERLETAIKGLESASKERHDQFLLLTSINHEADRKRIEGLESKLDVALAMLGSAEKRAILAAAPKQKQRTENIWSAEWVPAKPKQQKQRRKGKRK